MRENMDFDELVSVKISRGAHLFLRHVPTLGIQMSAFGSQAIIDKFRRDFPEIFDHIMKRENEDLEIWFDKIVSGEVSPYSEEQLELADLEAQKSQKD